MKITLDINDELQIRAKAVSAREKKMRALIEEGLRLRRRLVGGANARRTLPVYQGKGGLAKGIDPTSNRSMLDAAGDDA